MWYAIFRLCAEFGNLRVAAIVSAIWIIVVAAFAANTASFIFSFAIYGVSPILIGWLTYWIVTKA